MFYTPAALSYSTTRPQDSSSNGTSVALGSLMVLNIKPHDSCLVANHSKGPLKTVFRFTKLYSIMPAYRSRTYINACCQHSRSILTIYVRKNGDFMPQTSGRIGDRVFSVAAQHWCRFAENIEGACSLVHFECRKAVVEATACLEQTSDRT